MPKQPIVRNISSSAEESKALDARITHALERVPTVSIPADFAAMVARDLPVLNVPEVKATHYGRNASVLCFVVLIIALLLLAPTAGRGSVAMICLQWILCFQFALLAAWIVSKSMRPDFFR